jgi:hypothetical protein
VLERPDTKQGPRIECRSIAMCDANSILKAAPRNGGYRRCQHFRRNVDAEKSRLRIEPGREHQVSAGSAADLQHACAGAGPQACDQLVAAEQVISPCAVVDVALPAIHPVHATRGVNRPRGICANIGGISGHPGSP